MLLLKSSSSLLICNSILYSGNVAVVPLRLYSAKAVNYDELNDGYQGHAQHGYGDSKRSNYFNTYLHLRSPRVHWWIGIPFKPLKQELYRIH
jgi:hypothetical protein